MLYDPSSKYSLNEDESHQVDRPFTRLQNFVYNVCWSLYHHDISESNSVTEMLHGQFFAEQGEEEEEEEEDDDNYTPNGLDEEEFILPL